MLQLTLRIDALFEHFKQSANKLSQTCQSKSCIAPPDSLTKAMDGLFKYSGNPAWFARALSYWGHLEVVRLGARA